MAQVPDRSTGEPGAVPVQLAAGEAATDGSDPGEGRALSIGWLLDSPQPHVLFAEPERRRWPAESNDAAKSVTRCPAIAAASARHFAIACPYDLRLGFDVDVDGQPALVNLDGNKSAVREDRLHGFIDISPRDEWRTPDRPIVQMALPYVFVADDVAYLTQSATFMDYRPNELPGLVLSGRFPIHIWPRRLAWAFEWHDTERPLVLRRGEPLFYVSFETTDPERPIRLIEAELTDDIQVFLDEIADAVSYVSNSFSLFESAGRIRPERLLVPKTKRG